MSFKSHSGGADSWLTCSSARVDDAGRTRSGQPWLSRAIASSCLDAGVAGAQGWKFQEGGTHLRQGLPEAEDGVTEGNQPECLGHLPSAGSSGSFSQACRGVARRATLLARLLWAVLWLPQQKSLLTPACCQLTALPLAFRITLYSQGTVPSFPQANLFAKTGTKSQSITSSKTSGPKISERLWIRFLFCALGLLSMWIRLLWIRRTCSFFFKNYP